MEKQFEILKLAHRISELVKVLETEDINVHMSFFNKGNFTLTYVQETKESKNLK